MSGLEETLTIQSIQQALASAGVEIYRTDDHELQIAERVRLHIMDSGVRVVMRDGLAVQFTARTQRSDAPSAQPDELFRRVREEVGEAAGTSSRTRRWSKSKIRSTKRGCSTSGTRSPTANRCGGSTTG